MVRLRGLPYEATKADITKFFDGKSYRPVTSFFLVTRYNSLLSVLRVLGTILLSEARSFQQYIIQAAKYIKELTIGLLTLAVLSFSKVGWSFKAFC